MNTRIEALETPFTAKKASRRFFGTAKKTCLLERANTLTGEPGCFGGTVRNIEKKHLPGAFFSSPSARSLLPSWLKSLILNPIAVENWWEMSLVELGLREKAVPVFRSGRKAGEVGKENFEIYISERSCEFNSYPIKISTDSVEFKFNGRNIRLFYPGDGLGDIPAVFIRQDYAWLQAQGKEVVDIGASIGDSAVYFALQGARRVYAIEPYPYSCGFAEKNASASGMAGAITVINAGIASKNGGICIDPDYKNNVGSTLQEFGNGKKVPIYTLDNLARKLGVSDAILKLDCEGGEYCAILGSENSTLRKFVRIAVEYHHGYRNLKQKLESAAFEVKVTPPVYCYSAGKANPHFMQGYIYAERK